MQTKIAILYIIKERHSWSSIDIDTESPSLTPLVLEPGPRFNKKMTSYQYRKYHCGDKTVVRSSYLHNGISYNGKVSSLYWIGPRIFQINKSLLLLLMPGTILDMQSKSLFPMRRDLNGQIWVSRKCKYIFVIFIQQSGNYSDIQYIGHNSQKDTPLGARKIAFGPDCNDSVIDFEMWTGSVIYWIRSTNKHLLSISNIKVLPKCPK